MTATEELRRLLDERGVEYRTHGTTDRTWFEVGRISWFICERENGNFTADAVFLTPAQAIDATLGRGTCKVVSKPFDMWECECGKAWWHGGAPNYCPNCGRKEVSE